MKFDFVLLELWRQVRFAYIFLLFDYVKQEHKIFFGLRPVDQTHTRQLLCFLKSRVLRLRSATSLTTLPEHCYGFPQCSANVQSGQWNFAFIFVCLFICYLHAIVCLAIHKIRCMCFIYIYIYI